MNPLFKIKNTTKRTWFSFLYFIVNIVVVFGIVCPNLISYDDDFVVIAGIVILLLDASHLLFFIINFFKSFKNEKNL